MNARADLSFPWIQNLHLCRGKIAGIPRNDCQVVMDRGRGEQSVDNRYSDAFAFRIRREYAPTLSDRRINRQDPSREPRRQINVQPFFNARPTRALIESRKALSNLAE